MAPQSNLGVTVCSKTKLQPWITVGTQVGSQQGVILKSDLCAVIRDSRGFFIHGFLVFLYDEILSHTC